jgi:hypothetical protein
MSDVFKPTTEVSWIISATLVALTALVCYAYYSVNDRILMAQNIQSALEKGVDPLSVRCSYADSDDTICAVHAAAPFNSSVITKK